MIINNYPYTDFHEMNLDWIIKKVKEIDMTEDEALKKLIKAGIEKYFDKMMVEATYDQENELIILASAYVVVGDGDHVYSREDHSMTITDLM